VSAAAGTNGSAQLSKHSPELTLRACPIDMASLRSTGLGRPKTRLVLLAVLAGDDDSDLRPQAHGLFEKFPTCGTGEGGIQQKQVYAFESEGVLSVLPTMESHGFSSREEALRI
jgi:hypothetical protein